MGIATRLKIQAQNKKSEAEIDENEIISENGSKVSKYSHEVSIPGFKSNSSGSIGKCLDILGDNLNEIFDGGDDSEDESRKNGNKKSKKGQKKSKKYKENSDDGDDSDSESEPELIL